MRRFRVVMILVLLALVFAGGLGIGVLVRSALAGRDGLQPLNTATVLQQVQTLSQLVTIKYVLEKVVVLEDVKWFGENRVLLLAHGVVKAGVDLTRLKPEDISVEGQTVKIFLPRAQITDAYLDDNQTRVIERSTGLLRNFDKDLEQTARANAVDDIRRAARTAGIQKDADERARDQVEALLRQMGYERIEFQSR